MLIRPDPVHIGHSDGITTKIWVGSQYACVAHVVNLIDHCCINTALKKLEHDFWIELESTYRERIVQRKALYAANGTKVMDALPGTELASR